MSYDEIFWDVRTILTDTEFDGLYQMVGEAGITRKDQFKNKPWFSKIKRLFNLAGYIPGEIQGLITMYGIPNRIALIKANEVKEEL